MLGAVQLSAGMSAQQPYASSAGHGWKGRAAE